MFKIDILRLGYVKCLCGKEFQCIHYSHTFADRADSIMFVYNSRLGR